MPRPGDRCGDREGARPWYFITGPEVAAFEAKLATFCGARFAVACGNGTDALQLALMAKGVGPGDAVIVPNFTLTATAEAVALVGGTPVLFDVQAVEGQRAEPACHDSR